ncbi:MAG: glutathione S-transferase domain-containing protein [Planctomycetaceae bacterium]|nr:glutathione S-transferase domain-containing protein [Planctomycetaceae bacterium]
MKNKENNLIHIRTASRRYGLPAKWLREQAKSGAIPALVADNQVLFDSNILAEWLQERAQTGDARG